MGTSGYKEAGEFFYGFLSQAIVDFFQKKDDPQNESSITTIESWRPMISMLDYLKSIHNLSQSYLLSPRDMLFGNGDNKITSSNTSLGDIKKKWDTHYQDFYRQMIRDFTIKQETLLEETNGCKVDIAQLNKAISTRTAVSNDLKAFKQSAPLAHSQICKFVSGLNTVEVNIKNGNNGKYASWGNQITTYAKDSVRHSDDSLLKLIPILTFLYEEVLR